jgi:hypothetical protein
MANTSIGFVAALVTAGSFLGGFRTPALRARANNYDRAGIRNPSPLRTLDGLRLPLTVEQPSSGILNACRTIIHSSGDLDYRPRPSP